MHIFDNESTNSARSENDMQIMCQNANIEVLAAVTSSKSVPSSEKH